MVDLTEVFLVVFNSIFDIGETKGLFSAVANTGGFVSSVLTNLTNTNSECCSTPQLVARKKVIVGKKRVEDGLCF